MEQRIKIFRYIFLPQIANVCVDVARGSNIGMPDPFGYVLQLPALVVKDAGCAVTNVMETQVRQTMLFQYLLKSTGNVIRAEWFSILPSKDIS